MRSRQTLALLPRPRDPPRRPRPLDRAALKLRIRQYGQSAFITGPCGSGVGDPDGLLPFEGDLICFHVDRRQSMGWIPRNLLRLSLEPAMAQESRQPRVWRLRADTSGVSSCDFSPCPRSLPLGRSWFLSRHKAPGKTFHCLEPLCCLEQLARGRGLSPAGFRQGRVLGMADAERPMTPVAKGVYAP